MAVRLPARQRPTQAQLALQGARPNLKHQLIPFLDKLFQKR